jgi:hypothetical protein
VKRFGLLASLVALPAWASHPLISEDTDVLDKGEWELELHGERAREEENGVRTRRYDPAAQISYGVARNAQVEFELPYIREVTDGEVAKGAGDVRASVKWRFYEKNALSLVFKPDLMLPTGRDEIGFGAGRVRWAANLVGGYDTGKLQFLAHLGYTDNRNRVGERRSLWHASTAVLYSVTEKLRLVADYGHESQPDPTAGTHDRELVLGATYALSERIDLGLGVKKGLNDSADDRSLRMGLKLRFQ